MLRNALLGLAASAAVAAAASAQPASPPGTADEVIARSLAARGGLDRLKAVQSVRMTGTMSMGPMEMPITVEIKRPDKFRADMKFQGSDTVQAYDGHTAWIVPPMGGGQARALPADAARQTAEQADIDGPLVDSKAKGVQIELVGKRKVEGADAYDLKVTKGTDVDHYLIDATSWLPVRLEAHRTVAGTTIDGETTFGDYKAVAGWKWPYAIENGVRDRTEKQTITIDKIEVNVPIDDARFTMPAAKPAQSPKD